MIIPMLCVTIFVILVVWFLLPRVARLMIHTPTAISIFVCLSMVQLMAVFISMRCTLCGHFLQVALTLILVVGRSEERFSRNAETDLVCRLLLEKKNKHATPLHARHATPSFFFYCPSDRGAIHSFPTRRSSDLRVARLMIHTPTAISIFVCLSMVQLMAVFISMRCTLCGHFLQVALTLILVVG